MDLALGSGYGVDHEAQLHCHNREMGCGYLHPIYRSHATTVRPIQRDDRHEINHLKRISIQHALGS